MDYKVGKTPRVIMLVSTVFFLLGCDQIGVGKKEEKKPKDPELEALTALYASYGSEDFDDVALDQEAEGLKWYPDTEEYAPIPILEQPRLEDIESSPTFELKPFYLNVYTSESLTNIEYHYTLDASRTDEWSVFYEQEDITAERNSIYIDYQDFRLFGFDYYLQPELLRIRMTYESGVEHEVFIQPAAQQLDVHVIGNESKGIITRGISNNRVVFLRNHSGLVWNITINFKDSRLESTEMDPAQSIELALEANVLRHMQIPFFMKDVEVVAQTPLQDFSRTLTQEDLYPSGSVGCLVTRYIDDTVSATPVLPHDFPDCVRDGTSYFDWVLLEFPELTDPRNEVIEGKLPGAK